MSERTGSNSQTDVNNQAAAAEALKLAIIERGAIKTVIKAEGQSVDFSAMLDAPVSLFRVGDALQIAFGDGGTLIVEEFFVGDPASSAIVLSEEQTLSLEEFGRLVQIVPVDQIQTASGEGAPIAGQLETPQSSGQNFQEAEVSNLGDGLFFNELLGPENQAGQLDTNRDLNAEDDIPTAGAADSGFVSENGLVDGDEVLPVARGGLGIDFGQDGRGFGNGNRALTFELSAEGIPLDEDGNPMRLTSDGQALDYEVRTAPDGSQTLIATRTIVIDDGESAEIVFTVLLDVQPDQDQPAGEFVFTLHGNLDHPDPEAADLIGLNFQFTASDRDGDSVTSNFLIEVEDDLVEIGAAENGSVHEDGTIEDANEQNGTLAQQDDNDDSTDPSNPAIAKGNLNVSWGADDADADGSPVFGADRTLSFSGQNSSGPVTVDAPAAETESTPIPLKANNEPVSVVVGPDGVLYGYTGANPYPAEVGTQSLAAETTLIFKITLDDDGSGSYTFELLENLDHFGDNDETLSLTFGFTAKDSDGDTATNEFTVSVGDDIVTIDPSQIVAGSVDEEGLSGGNHGDSYSDKVGDAADLAGVATKTAGALGISWGADSGNSVESTGLANDGEPQDDGSDRSLTFDEKLDGKRPDGITSDGEQLVYSLNDAGTVLTAHKVDTDEAVFTVSLDDTIDSGSYTFNLLGNLDHPRANEEDDLDLTFGFTAKDSDGDTASSSFTVTVDDDAVALTDANVTRTVDEDNIFSWFSLGTSPDWLDWDKDGNWTEFFTGGSAVVGDLSSTVSFGADGPHPSDAFTFVADAEQKMNALGLKSKSEAVSFKTLDVPGDYTVLIGFVDNGTLGLSEDDRPVVTLILNEDTGKFAVLQFDQLDHVDGNDDNTALVHAGTDELTAIDFGSVIQAQDQDGDTVTLDNKLEITFKDDVPELYVRPTFFTTVRVDENAGHQPGELSENETKDILENGVFKGLQGASDPHMDAPQIARADIVHIVRNDGADDTASLTQKLVITDPASSAEVTSITTDLFTTEGEPIKLMVENGLIVGRSTTLVDDGNGRGGTVEQLGDVAFALHLDADGTVTVVQYQSLLHATSGVAGERVDLGGYVSASFTLTDHDGDKDTKVAAIGNKIIFRDDAPEITSFTPGTGSLLVDETSGVQGDEIDVQPDSDLVALFGSLQGARGVDPEMETIYAKASDLIAEPSYEGGADGATHSMEFVDPNGVNSGLDTTSGADITLYLRGSGTDARPYFVVGQFVENGEPQIAFALHLNEQSGEVSFVQYVSLDNINGAQGDVLTLADKLSVKLTVTDGDGDTDSRTINIGDKIVFHDDDVVLANSAVTRTVDENDIATTTVLGTSPNDGAADDGSITNGSDGAATVTASLANTVSFGADGVKAGGGFSFLPITLTSGEDTIASVLAGENLKSHGQTVEYSLDGSTLTGFVMVGDPTVKIDVFTLDLQNNGAVEFKLFDQIDHDLHSGSKSIDFGQIIVATDGDGDTVVLDGKLNIKVSDDQPVIVEATNLVENGSFELPGLLTDQSHAHLEALDDWQSDSVFRYNGADTKFEVHRSIDGSTAKHGKLYLELDKANADETTGVAIDNIYQNIDTDEGVVYQLSFAFADRAVTQGDSTIEVWWSGTKIGEVSTSSTDWQQATFLVVGTDNATDKLEFREVSSENDGAGAYLDDVQLVEAMNLVHEADIASEPATVEGDLSILWGTDDANATTDSKYANGKSPSALGTDRTIEFTLENGSPIVTSVGGVSLKVGSELVETIVVDGILYGYTGTAPVNGAVPANKVFTVELFDGGAEDSHNNGTFKFTLHQELTHKDADGNPIDFSMLEIGYTATDSDGDSVSSTFTVTVKDDVPSAGESIKPFIADEEGFHLIDGHQLAFDLGADDGVNGTSVVDAALVTGDSSSGVVSRFITNDVSDELTVNNVHVQSKAFKEADGQIKLVGYTGSEPASADAGNIVFVISIQPDGTYSFDHIVAFDHPESGSAKNEIDIRFRYTVEDADGDLATGTAAITITDTVPTQQNAETTTVSEASFVVMGENLIENGSFEDVTGAHVRGGTPGKWAQYNPADVPGWEASPDYIEIQDSGFDGRDALHGDKFLEVDARATTNGSRDVVSQQVTTEAGKNYLLEFYVAARAGNGEGETLHVLWNDTVVATRVTNTSDGWQKVALIVTGTAGLDTLKFAELNTQDDRYGLLIDNVSLREVVSTGTPDPTSATGSLGIEWGADDGNLRSVELTGAELPSNLTSNGMSVLTAVIGDKLVGYVGGEPTAETDGNVIFVVSVDASKPNGEYTFDLVGRLDHDNSADEQLIFKFTAKDSDGDSLSQDGQFIVKVADTAPSAPQGDTASVAEDGSIDIDVLRNDTVGVDGAQVKLAAVGPANGIVSLNADGTVNYTPNADFHGVDYFHYSLVDAEGNETPIATVTVTVTAVNDAPEITNVSMVRTVDEGFSTTDVLFDVNAIDIDVNDTVTYSLSGTDAGAFTIDSDDGEIRFNTSPDYENPSDANDDNTYSFSVTADDGNGGTDTKTVTVNVEDMNEAPETTEINRGSVTEDAAPVEIDLLAGQTDPENNDLSVVNLTVKDQNGVDVVYSIDADGKIRIDPAQFDSLNTGQQADITIRYGVHDGNLTTQNTATLTVTGITDNFAPVLEFSETDPQGTIIASDDFSSRNLRGGSGWEETWQKRAYNDAGWNGRSANNDIYVNSNEKLWVTDKYYNYENSDYYSGDGYDAAASREVDLTSVSKPKISFDLKAHNFENGDTAEVVIRWQDTNGDWSKVARLMFVDHSDKYEEEDNYSFDLSDIADYTPGPTRIEFVAHGQTMEAGDYLRIDNVVVSGEGAPLDPTQHSATYSFDAAGVGITRQANISDQDGDEIKGATITLTNHQVGDSLIYTAQGAYAGIAGSLAVNGAGELVLSLSGAASSSVYQEALDSIRFHTISDQIDTPRNISVTVSDGVADSAAITTTLMFDYDAYAEKSGNGYLIGTSQPNLLIGGDGNDYLYGQDYNDVLFGGGGDDRLRGYNGDDVLFGGSGRDNLYGHSGDDVLNGGRGSDRLYGGSGDNILNGGAGADYLESYSGDNSDTFVFDTLDYSVDEIVGFDHTTYDGEPADETDQLDISALLDDAFGDHGGSVDADEASNYVKIVHNNSNGSDLFVDTDGADNGENWVKVAQLNGVRDNGGYQDTVRIVLDEDGTTADVNILVA
ncbi:DUF5801 repeats-in-toxin domain-containing protein [Pseudovibrio sp. SCP19]|uniref:T1SS-143 repeat domain-containing protein n=1 Tax=Pseudovibrio sp. SCP19 TaxID=3141374 RepID=UPI00333C7DCE